MTTLEEEFLPPSNPLALAGYIFKCNDITMPICLERMVFGLDEPYMVSVEKITPGIPLFLYNCQTCLLHGVFEAADSGGDNIDPEFFRDDQNPGRSLYPAQVRVKWYHKYDEPLPAEFTKEVVSALRVKKNKFRIELGPNELQTYLKPSAKTRLEEKLLLVRKTQNVD